MNDEILDPKVLANLQAIIVDIIAGDDTALARPEYRSLSMTSIQQALKFLLESPIIDDKQRAYLMANSWRINYRDKPPSVEDFITERYLGRAAIHTYDRIKTTFVDFMNPTKPYRNLVLYPHIGWGKASRLDARVYTPEGYKLMRDVKVGDTVATPSGSAAKVMATFDQPASMLYKVTMSDGRSTVVHKDHLWKAARSWNGAKECWKIISTEDILASGNLKEQRWWIPLTEPVQHTAKSHIIPSYTLGVLLGDGCLGKHALSLCGDDKEIFDRVEAEMPEELVFRYSECKETDSTCFSAVIRNKKPYAENRYRDELDRLELTEKVSFEKFIPEEYLYDSVDNRIALLQGLMDTDGTASVEGYCTFYSTSLQLCKDVLQLVQSLGGYGRVQGDLHGRADQGRPEYLVSVSFPDRDFPVFSLKRRQQRLIERATRLKAKKRGRRLFIESIEPFAEEESKCILLDDEDHLYLTDEYIVTHNSYLATLINIYVGVHLSMMRNPYKFFGLNPASVLSQLLVSYSLKKSSELLLEPLIAILEASPFFEKVHTRDGMIKKDQVFERQESINKIYWTTAVPTSAIQFSNGANFKLVSNVQNLLGLSVVTGTMSELAFFRDAGKTDEYIMRMFNDLKNRIDSRMKGNYFGRSILDSSPNTLDSPIDDYVINHAARDPTNYIISGSQWKWAPEEYDMSHTFSVYTGGKGQPPRIIDEAENLEGLNPSKIIEVPNSLRQFFVDDLYKSLKDRAGIPAGSADSLIYDYSKIDRIFDERLKNVYTHITASSEETPSRLIWNQIAHLFFRSKAGKLEFWYKPYLPRCISVDQSLSQDVSCIAASHVERIAGTDDQMYVVDFTIPIAPEGARVSLDAIRLFIQELRDLGGMNISHVSFDQFQSEAAIQYLKTQNFEVEKLSVDLTTDPYFYLMTLIDTGKIAIGRNLYVKNNLKSLKIVKPNTKTGRIKVDHEDARPVITAGNTDWEKSMIGFFAKDATDAIAGSVELLRRYHPVAYDTWDPAKLDTFASLAAEKADAGTKMQTFLQAQGMRV